MSDTHSHFGNEIVEKLPQFDELWHAGDWGTIDNLNIPSNLNVRGVYGNIDDQQIRSEYPKELYFQVEKLTVYMTHIGGYPGKYQKLIKKRLEELKPDLYICGHSHICKIMKDHNLDLIHFNPGAIGYHGFHSKRTMIDFSINQGKIKDVKIHEYDK
ncbi:MAG: metallophosphoesterase family protein [Bacteroidia bacterium]|nr:metallophosphoesterase family protein [Bacteroidia bacterium]